MKRTCKQMHELGNLSERKCMIMVIYQNFFPFSLHGKIVNLLDYEMF